MNDGIVKLKNVRLSFPQLFEAKAMEDGGKPRFSAAFLIDPQTPEGRTAIKAVKQQMNIVAEDKWGKGKVPKSVKFCLNDGNTKDYDGYEDRMYLSAGNSADRPPTVGKWDKSLKLVVSATPEEVYAGCHVHAVVTFWAQDNQYGKRVNANLQAVIFYKDGEPFGAGRVDANKLVDEDDFDFTDGEEEEEADFMG